MIAYDPNSTEFSVAVFYDDGTHAYIERWLSPRMAVKQARIVIANVAPDIAKVIITDGGDDTVFLWERGKGVVFPPVQPEKLST